jgi:undecaprenyl diphosphate synthase
MKSQESQPTEANATITTMQIPNHVAIIMDGNGRWATQRQLPRLSGHQSGTENIDRVIEHFSRYGVNYITLYAFSTENWARPDEEIKGLLNLLSEVITKEANRLDKNNVRILHLGNLSQIEPDLRYSIKAAIELTQGNTGLTLCIAFNYGSRSEILEAIRQIIYDRIDAEDISEDLLSSYLYTADIPNPDLIIRTAGELRLSNFLLWQAAYAEYYSTPTLWPDFGEAEVEKSLEAYSQRHRRFGGLKT